MTRLPGWRDLQRGIGCPFDRPREGIGEHLLFIRELDIATLYLSREQTYRGTSLLIFDPRHVTRIDELTRDEWSALAGDLGAAERAVFDAFRPDHINVASLGSLIPHLHWHIIPRYESDLRWGGPVWTTRLEEMPKTLLAPADYDAMIAAVRVSLDSLH